MRTGTLFVRMSAMDDWEMAFLQKSSRRRHSRKRQDLLRAAILLALIGAAVAGLTSIFVALAERLG